MPSRDSTTPPTDLKVAYDQLLAKHSELQELHENLLDAYTGARFLMHHIMRPHDDQPVGHFQRLRVEVKKQIKKSGGDVSFFDIDFDSFGALLRAVESDVNSTEQDDIKRGYQLALESFPPALEDHPAGARRVATKVEL